MKFKFTLLIVGIVLVSGLAMLLINNEKVTEEINSETTKTEGFDVVRAEEIKQEIKNASYCEVDDDCGVLESDCPFGCYLSVNVKEEDKISSLIKEFKSSCNYNCVNNFGAICKENKCEMVFSIVKE